MVYYIRIREDTKYMIRWGWSVYDWREKERVQYTWSGESAVYMIWWREKYTISEECTVYRVRGRLKYTWYMEGEVDNITGGWGKHQRKVKSTLSWRVKDIWSEKHKSGAGEINMVAVYIVAIYTRSQYTLLQYTHLHTKITTWYCYEYEVTIWNTIIYDILVTFTAAHSSWYKHNRLYYITISHCGQTEKKILSS